MASYCPLCAKSGIKRRIKAFQINFEEALWACESEECIWPFGCEELKIFPRLALSCTWEEEPAIPVKEENNGPGLAELSLYTPPVTPGQELSKELTETVSAECSMNPPAEDKVRILPNKYDFIAKESTDSNESPLLELIELGSINHTEGNDSLTSKQIADGINDNKILPRIISIEKTNINLKIISNTDKHDDNDDGKVQSQSLTNTMDTVEIFNLSDGACTELGLNVLHKTGSKLRNETGELQSNIILNANSMETSSMLSESATKMLVDVDNTHSLNTTNESLGNISTNSDIDVILEDIINDENYIIMDINDDWLNSLIS